MPTLRHRQCYPVQSGPFATAPLNGHPQAWSANLTLEELAGNDSHMIWNANIIKRVRRHARIACQARALFAEQWVGDLQSAA
jgi:hypothetical protein